MSDRPQTWFSERQSWVAKHPRNRTSLAREAVEFILQTTLRGNLHVSGHGLHLRRFRDFVGHECRLEADGLDIDITLIDDEDGKPVQYRFFCNQTFRIEELADSTVRGLVSRVAKAIERKK